MFMKTYVGNGQGAAGNALETATKGLTAPSMILFIAPFEKLQETAVYLKKKYPDADTIGTIGCKMANGAAGEDNIVVVGFFSDTKCKCGVLEHLSTCPVASIADIQAAVAQVSPGKEDTVCLEFCTNDEEKLVTTMNAGFGKREIPLIGGTAFGTPDGAAAAVAYNGQIYEDACVYAIIKNLSGRIKVFKENIYRKRNTISHIATKVDVKRKALIELDDKPAASVYSQELGIPKEKIIDNVFQNPIGRAVGDKVFISSMKELGKNGEIINFKRINKNDCIYFLELDDYKRVGRETREAIRSQLGKISFVFTVNCAYRHALFEKEGYTRQYIQDMEALGVHVGVVAGGEQFRNQHANQTMLCAVFE